MRIARSRWCPYPRATCMRRIVLSMGCMLPLGTLAHAQGMQGTVVARDETAAVAGAVVLLIDSLDRPMARTLSGEGGYYSLFAPAAGHYRLRILRIGYAPSLLGPFRLRTGETLSQRAVLTGQSIRLDAVHVRASPQCLIRPDSTQAAFVVWEEARKALVAAAVTQSTRPTVHLRRYERSLNAADLAVQREEQHEERGESNRPFVSVSPDMLFTGGFVRRDATGTTYFAPDADVLLSERFADTHCLKLVADTREGEEQLGVEFSPVDTRADRPDIRGTLWIGRRSAELRTVEFRYTGLPAAGEAANVGGELEFLRLPNGSWTVGRWQIRMPVFTVREGVTLAPTSAMGAAGRLERRRVTELAALQVVGGEVLDVSRDGQMIWSRHLATLTLRLVDSATSFPLSTIRGTVEGANRTITTDATGTATVPGILPGTYVVSFQLPILDSLSLGAFRAHVTVEETAVTLATIRAPTRNSLLASACGADVVPDDDATLVGVVMDAESESPVPRAVVIAQWQERFARLTGGYTFRTERRQVRADSAGRYRICGIPRDTPILVSAGLLAPLGVATKLRVPAGESLAGLRLNIGMP